MWTGSQQSPLLKDSAALDLAHNTEPHRRLLPLDEITDHLCSLTVWEEIGYSEAGVMDEVGHNAETHPAEDSHWARGTPMTF